MLRYTIALITALFCSVAAKAATLQEFCYEDSLTGEIRCGLIFKGVVYQGDAEALERAILENDVGMVIINSPGGSAVEGLALNEVARKYSLRTIAGKDFGAWSAAAVFWMGGTMEWESITESLVGMHWAYMPGMPEYNTDLINSLIAITVYDAMKGSRDQTKLLLIKMEMARHAFGTQGFVIRSQSSIWEVKDMNSSQALRDRLDSISTSHRGVTQ